jgi:hypothetical protein
LRLLHTAVAAALALLLGPAAQSEAQRRSGIEYYYQPEAIESLDGRVFSLESLRGGTQRPLGKLHFVHGEYDRSVFSTPTLWSVNLHTALAGASAPQKKESVPGDCSAFQVDPGSEPAEGSANWIMQTSCSALSPDPAHRFVNMQANVAWPTERMPQPWITPNSRFALEFSLRLPSAGVNDGARAYATAQVAIHDGDGHYFWLQPPLFLYGFPRGAEKQDQRGFDQDVPYINPAYRRGGRYLSKLDRPATGQVSSVTSSQPWSGWHWYAFTISRSQLRHAVADLNASGGRFSTDWSRYRVSFIGVQTEINRQAAIGKTPQGWIDIGLKQLNAYRLY